MSAPIPLRRDFDASQLRSLAKKTKDGALRRSDGKTAGGISVMIKVRPRN
jgi:hypothetical protein